MWMPSSRHRRMPMGCGNLVLDIDGQREVCGGLVLVMCDVFAFPAACIFPSLPSSRLPHGCSVPSMLGLRHLVSRRMAVMTC